MNARVLAAALVLGLAGCVTTGDPRQGGLFGWSESMARERVAERERATAAAEAELAREQGRTQRESGRLRSVRQAENRAAGARDQAEAELRAREAAVSAKAAQLQTESATPSSASRAHQLRTAVDAIRRDARLSPRDRAQRLRQIEVQIDEARARLGR